METIKLSWYVGIQLLDCERREWWLIATSTVRPSPDISLQGKGVSAPAPRRTDTRLALGGSFAASS